MQGVVPTQCEVRIGFADEGTVVAVNRAIAIQILKRVVSGCIQAFPYIAIESTNGLTHFHTVHTIGGYHTGGGRPSGDEFQTTQILHLILQVGAGKGRAPSEVRCVDDVGINREVDTGIAYFGCIHPIGTATIIVRDGTFQQTIFRPLVEVVERHAQPTIQYGKVNTQVKLMGGLPTQVRSGYRLSDPITGILRTWPATSDPRSRTS